MDVADFGVAAEKLADAITEASVILPFLTRKPPVRPAARRAREFFAQAALDEIESSTVTGELR